MAGFAQHIVDKDKGTSYEQPNLIDPVPSKKLTGSHLVIKGWKSWIILKSNIESNTHLW